MKPYRRSQRLQSEILKDISYIFREEVKDPRLKDIVIINVEVSDDLQRAIIYYSFFKKPLNKKEFKTVLSKANGYIRKKLAERLFIKRVPALSFKEIYENGKDARIY